MDCLRAQNLISDAVDRSPVDPEELSAAKTHCRECADCAAFVRALLAIERAGLPEPPADLADRVMERVRAEASRAAAAQTAATVDTTAAAPSVIPIRSDNETRSWADLLARARDPRNRRAVTTWAAAAAVVFVAAGIGAVAGVRAILVPQQAAIYSGSAESASTSALDAAAPESSGLQSFPDEQQRESDAVQKSQAPAPDFINVSASVYRLTGPAPTIDTESLSPIGTTRSDLGESGGSTDYDVLGTGDPAIVYIDDGSRVLAFQRVTRSYGGRLYVLQSGPIESFGAWATLPPGFRTPTSEDGSPVFEAVGTDESGTPVYRASDTPPEEGIAIGPNPPLADPVAGSPEWTWWKVAP
jgi:bacterioferritin-associated ferredoxin